MRWVRIANRGLSTRVCIPFGDAITQQRKAFALANLLVRSYYGVTLYLLANRLNIWADWLVLKEISPIWPIVWVNLTGISVAVHVIMGTSLVAAFLTLLFPEKRVLRILLFVSLLEYVAFSNSFGKINHDWHNWLMVAFFFIFLPHGRQEQIKRSITRRQLYLTAFWGAQLSALAFYSLSGVWKVVVGGSQLLRGEVHAFSPDALAYHIANRLLQTNSPSMMGSFIVEHPLVGWPMYLGIIYVQLFAFVAAFRPSLHRLWGGALICFHLGSYFTMSINFPQNILLLVLFFISSPFSPQSYHLSTILGDLPLIGWALKRAFGIFELPRRDCSKAAG